MSAEKLSGPLPTMRPMNDSAPRTNRDGRRPLVLVDVDGVINDLGFLLGVQRSWPTCLLRSHGFVVAVPAYMPELMRHLTRVAEVWWCTTWREAANDEIARHLGVGPLKVVDDGTGNRYVDWKPPVARPVAEAALAAGRRVYWIEDFAGDAPRSEMPDGVVFIDTAAGGEFVLLPEHLPTDLGPTAAAA
jgi:hypothetical protein